MPVHINNFEVVTNPPERTPAAPAQAQTTADNTRSQADALKQMICHQIKRKLRLHAD